MIIVVAVAALSLWAAIATVETVLRDGYRAVPFDPTYDSRLGTAALSPAPRA